LFRFFMTHNHKPEMAIKIHGNYKKKYISFLIINFLINFFKFLGYHRETHDESYTSTDSDGNRTVHYQTTTVEVTDFNFTFDLTEYISNNGIINTISKNNK